jgi:uncharacterized protein YqgC (DUF456 family)
MRPGPVEILAALTAAVAIAVAMVGTVIPAFPGLVIAWLAMLIFGLIVGFDAIGIVIMSVVTLLVAGSYILTIRIPQQQVERRGASRTSTIFGGVGAIVGFFVIPVVGFIVGGVAGVFGAEYYRTRERSQAWESTKGVLIGFGLSALAQLGIGVIIAVLFAVWLVAKFDL